MPRWKTTEQITNLCKNNEIFDENWMNYDSIFQYMPEPAPWTELRQPTTDEIDVWEVISEVSNGKGFIGVYAAWQPYHELYIVTHEYNIINEFSGWNANKRLEKYLISKNIPYPKGPDLPTEDYEKSLIVVK